MAIMMMKQNQQKIQQAALPLLPHATTIRKTDSASHWKCVCVCIKLHLTFGFEFSLVVSLFVCMFRAIFYRTLKFSSFCEFFIGICCYFSLFFAVFRLFNRCSRLRPRAAESNCGSLKNWRKFSLFLAHIKTTRQSSIDDWTVDRWRSASPQCTRGKTINYWP